MATSTANAKYYIGLMSGTSADGRAGIEEAYRKIQRLKILPVQQT